MRLLFTIISLCCSFAVVAQDVKEIKYTVDTVTALGMTVPIRRSSDGELEKYIAQGGKSFNLANPLMRLEKELTDADAYIRAGRRKITWYAHMQELLAQIKKADPKFNVTDYEQEMKLYERYNASFGEMERRHYAKADSFKKVQKWQEAKAQKESEAVIAARVRKQDSLKRVYDSLGKLALRRETQAREDLFIRKFGRDFGPKIASGHVATGMNQEMCLNAWGEPSGKKQTEREGVKIEIWNYGTTGWLKFQDGSLVASSGEK